MNLSPYNELGHSHGARYEPETHQTKAALLSLLTTGLSSSLTFLCHGAQCSNMTRSASLKTKYTLQVCPERTIEGTKTMNRGL